MATKGSALVYALRNLRAVQAQPNLLQRSVSRRRAAWAKDILSVYELDPDNLLSRADEEAKVEAYRSGATVDPVEAVLRARA